MIGAAFGRMVGEGMALWFPHGIQFGHHTNYICPGGYATVGAAAFTGAATHTLSISVIVFEMTGQITHAIPILIAVLVANAIAACLGPSCYDSIILIKKLPYLPDIVPSSSGAYNFFVEDFMVTDIKYIWYGMSFAELREILRGARKLRGFPLVDSPTQMVLLGSVQRTELITAIEKHIGKERRLAEASRRRALEREATMRQQEEARIRELQQQLERLSQDRETEEEEETGPRTSTARRPSRFAISSVQEPEPSLLAPAWAGQHQGQASRKLKGILKKNEDSSHTIHGHPAPAASPFTSPYQTVSGAGNWRNTVQNVQQIFKRTLSSRASSGWDFGEGLLSPGHRKVLRPEMTLEEQREWERQEMDKVVNFTDIHIDPAPFQLVEKSSLLKVHSLFSMLGVNHAYVTTIGRLIGVVGLKELRKAIEDANSGQSPASKVETKEDEESVTGSGGEESETNDNNNVDKTNDKEDGVEE